jgi:multidrug efflux pump
MTSFAFCAGVIPLIVGTGAGEEMRRAMGIAVFWGMVGVTSFGIFLTPVFYVLLRSLGGAGKLAGAGAAKTPRQSLGGAALVGLQPQGPRDDD